jgi:dethiobiotin synthetase
MTAREGGGFFVTGTDTGVGKTRVACALLHALAVRGATSIGMKPVAAGAQRVRGALVNDDVAALKAASSVAAPEALVNPYCFEPPVAPHIAAGEAGVTIDLARIKSAYAGLAALAEWVVVEGAGGFCVPLGRGFGTDDLARELGLPVILVVGMRLGCLNHALLTARAVRAAGLRLAAWAANEIEPDFAFVGENVETLIERLGAPLLARFAYAPDRDVQALAGELSLRHLQVPSVR